MHITVVVIIMTAAQLNEITREMAVGLALISRHDLVLVLQFAEVIADPGSLASLGCLRLCSLVMLTDRIEPNLVLSSAGYLIRALWEVCHDTLHSLR